jgi:hypothetical protein
MKKQDIIDMLDILKKNILANPLTVQEVEEQFKIVEVIVMLQDE